MRYITFSDDIENVNSAILIKDSCFNKPQLLKHYLAPLVADGIPLDTFIAFNLKYESNKVCTAKFAKEYLKELLEALNDLDVSTLLVCDNIYFKYLTNNQKTDPYYGYVCNCSIKGYEHIKIVLSLNYQILSYNPDKNKVLKLSLKTISNYLLGSYVEPGIEIIHTAYYPEDLNDIRRALQRLYNYSQLTCDIETVGLDFWNCGIATIAFAWTQHNGIAFAVDRHPHRVQIRLMLWEFFCKYTGTLIYHNIGFDGKVLAYNLWMRHLADYEGMLKGIDKITHKFEDTKLITYLATNNAVENVLKLKVLAQEFAGNYAQDEIKDTTKIPLDQLLKYNLIDALCTWYVLDKYEPRMHQDKQDKLYKELFKPSVKTLMQTELCGMPVDPTKIQEVKKLLQDIVDKHYSFLETNFIINDFHFMQLEELANAKTNKAKKKVFCANDPAIAKVSFNPNSGPQLQKLIYDYMGYDVIDLTDSKQPATGADTLTKLKANAKHKDHIAIFDSLIKLSQANKILTTFIPALEKAQQLPDDSYRFYGNFNLGGTQSMRLSSSKPNLQNLPANSIFAKLIKLCFVSTHTAVMVGSDFDSLEDKVNALITRDPNKLKVYCDLYDGHSLRAYYYFREQMPDITETVASINSIKKLYSVLRNLSKAPTFALTYMGTFITLMNNCGFTEEVAKKIEANYHMLYKVADEWIAAHIEAAKTLGYVPLAFGGRIRTPLLAQCKPGDRNTYLAEVESRSAGNAATQSYCILNTRSVNEFMDRVWKSKYRLDILPIAQIHDASYYTIPNDIHILKWVNDNLIECMAWDNLPELQHPIVKISSALDVFYKNWCNPITINNGISLNEIRKTCKKGVT